MLYYSVRYFGTHARGYFNIEGQENLAPAYETTKSGEFALINTTKANMNVHFHP